MSYLSLQGYCSKHIVPRQMLLSEITVNAVKDTEMCQTVCASEWL